MAPFTNCCIYAYVSEVLIQEFPNHEMLGRLITNYGGTVALAPITATHIICHNMQQDRLPEFKKSNVKLCSILWVFACIQADKTLSPDNHPLYRPFPAPAIPGAADFGEITLTGFSGIERRGVISLMQAAGFQFEGKMKYFDPESNVVPSALLIARNVEATSQKLDVAR